MANPSLGAVFAQSLVGGLGAGIASAGVGMVTGKKSSRKRRQTAINNAWANYQYAQNTAMVGDRIAEQQAGALLGAAGSQAGLLEWGARERFGLQAENIQLARRELTEETRRMRGEFGQIEAEQRARAAASGVEMGTGTTGAFLDESVAENQRQYQFFLRQGQRSIANMERERQFALDYAMQEAASIRAIAEMEAQALRYATRMQNLSNIYSAGLQYQAAGGDLDIAAFWRQFRGTPFIAAGRRTYQQAHGRLPGPAPARARSRRAPARSPWARA